MESGFCARQAVFAYQCVVMLGGVDGLPPDTGEEGAVFLRAVVLPCGEKTIALYGGVEEQVNKVIACARHLHCASPYACQARTCKHRRDDMSMV